MVSLNIKNLKKSILSKHFKKFNFVIYFYILIVLNELLYVYV